jgi:hypothetical protein
MSIPTTADGLQPFTPPSLRPEDPSEEPKVVFFFRIPTWQQRDEIQLKLYRYGVRQVSQDAVRAAMVSELWTIRPDTAESDALFLESFWQQSKLHEEALSEWRDREVQRLADIDAGTTKPREMEKPPELPIPIRERARAQMLTQELMDGSVLVRNKLADQHDYSRRFAELSGRIEIAGWQGLDCEPPKYDMSGVMKVESVEALRTALHKMGNLIGWQELCTEAQLMFELDREEVGNSVLPLESSSTADGSPLPQDPSAVASGHSTKPATGTKSNTGRTRGGGSRKPTGASSGSTGGSAAETKNDGLTAAP